MLNDSVAIYVERREAEFEDISAERRERLEEIAGFVRARGSTGKRVRLVFICTHNSRRSHISQIWAQAAAAYYQLKGVETFSGGTEATAFNARAVRALRRAGFEVTKTIGEDNPVYEVRYDDTAPSIQAFSKIFDQPPNPTHAFCAVMTCSNADGNCPVVPGAALRIAIPYEDPGDHDATEREQEAYDDCCRRIAREILYLFSWVRA